MADNSKQDGGDVNIGGHLMILEWSLAALSAIVLGLRLISASVVIKRVRMADYVMILSFMCAVVQGALLTESYKWGLGRHFRYLNNEEQVHSLKFVFLCQGWGIASAMFGRISVCLYILYVAASNKSLRFSLWFLVVTQALFNVLTITLIYAQCGTHPVALWDPSINAKCWSPNVQRNFGYFQSSLNSLTDLCLTVIPAILLRGVSLPLGKKLVIIFLLSLSVFTLIASIVKTYMIKNLGERGDFTWAMIFLHYWAVPENYVVIIAASIPPLSVLIRSGRQSKGGSQSYEMSGSKWKNTRSSHLEPSECSKGIDGFGSKTMIKAGSEENILGTAGPDDKSYQSSVSAHRV